MTDTSVLLISFGYLAAILIGLSLFIDTDLWDGEE